MSNHCDDCEESLSSKGLAEYQHTCRCYCKICDPPKQNMENVKN